MMEVHFTQYLRPDGKQILVATDIPDDYALIAHGLMNRGARLEIEVLTTGEVSMTCEFGPLTVAQRISKNGPQVQESICEMLDEASFMLVATHHRENAYRLMANGVWQVTELVDGKEDPHWADLDWSMVSEQLRAELRKLHVMPKLPNSDEYDPKEELRKIKESGRA